MAELPQPLFDAPVPGMAMTAELGGRPWQTPPQFTTVEEALDYYIPRLQSDEVSSQILDVLEMGVPVTTVANTMQLGSVMEGKHSIDVGMLIIPVLMELIMLVADTAGIEYESGTEKPKVIRSTLIDKAVAKFEKDDVDDADGEILSEDNAESVIKEMKSAAEKRAGGIMSRGM
tara:strand:+ start:693 stop:1214 length:522 start_codon:yes stop_codon:yes gene_type:complete